MKNKSGKSKIGKVQVNNQIGILMYEMKATLIKNEMRGAGVSCTLQHLLELKNHDLTLKKIYFQYGVESAALAPGYSAIQRGTV